jgi:DNA polymerase III subunit delta
MIVKSYEINKIISNYNFYLFYGKNQGLKNESIKAILKKNKGKVFSYEEKQIQDEKEIFFENILSGSLFEDNKIIIINRASDKIYTIIQELIEREIKSIKIIINSDVLEKKSKLRSLFEKKKDLICIPTYSDNSETLSKLANTFFKNEKILISQQNINLIVSKCSGDRQNLTNELEKIKNYSFNKQSITTQEILKLINLSENYGFSELIDNCLAKNKNKIMTILNENNFSNEDCIIILRTFLMKAKKILTLSLEFEKNKDLDKTITSARPPIFWKDKEIVKIQLNKWKPNKIKELIYHLNDIELQIKKNFNTSILIITNFILEKSSSETSS